MVEARPSHRAQPRLLAGQGGLPQQLIELIQYEQKVRVPGSAARSCRPWINKYYLLDCSRRTAWCATWSTGLHCVHGVLAEPGHFDGRHHPSRTT